MALQLPPNADIRYLRSQAKALVKDLKAGIPAAAQRTRDALPELTGLSDRELLDRSFSLKNAQRAIAREYGFGSWQELKQNVTGKPEPADHSNLNPRLTFDTFVTGQDNTFAAAAARQAVEHPGQANPLVFYGGSGSGKTHLLNTVGNEILRRDPEASVIHLTSQRYVADMVRALQAGAMQDFVRHLQSVGTLLIDDIQTFAHKYRAEEEFFHLFNALSEGGRQMVFTLDRYPSEIEGLEDRLKSRLVHGLVIKLKPVDVGEGSARHPQKALKKPQTRTRKTKTTRSAMDARSLQPTSRQSIMSSGLAADYTFASFITAKSNARARDAAFQLATGASSKNNPLLLYGPVGNGKTHLLQAIGNQLLAEDPSRTVLYVHSQKFVMDMVSALQNESMDQFVRDYTSPDALLFDGVQFFAKKLKSSTTFLQVFNVLLDKGHRIVMACDRYPREIEGLQETLSSSMVGGLTVEVEPPELEIRVAVLHQKARRAGVDLPVEAAELIAHQIRSNIRELEGTLNLVVAKARFADAQIDIEHVRRTLQDLFASLDRQIGTSEVRSGTDSAGA